MASGSIPSISPLQFSFSLDTVELMTQVKFRYLPQSTWSLPLEVLLKPPTPLKVPNLKVSVTDWLTNLLTGVGARDALVINNCPFSKKQSFWYGMPSLRLRVYCLNFISWNICYLKRISVSSLPIPDFLKFGCFVQFEWIILWMNNLI